MNFKKIVFILSLLGILSLIFITQATQKTEIGTIKSIRVSSSKITIQLKNYSAELIIFKTNHLDLKKGDVIKFQGKQEIYKNRKQIIIDKISLNH